MKRITNKLFITFLFSMLAHVVCAQEFQSSTNDLKQPTFALKTNLLYDATTTFNLGLEFRLGKKNTLTLPLNYNPWTFSDDKKFKHIATQPEFRFWTCEAFNGFYWGLHLHGGQFNAGNLKLPFGIAPTLENHRYEGYFYGGGLGLGYQWIINNRWNIELGMGVGYARIHYDKFKCGHCGEKIKSGARNYWGPDRLAISLIYIIK